MLTTINTAIRKMILVTAIMMTILVAQVATNAPEADAQWAETVCWTYPFPISQTTCCIYPLFYGAPITCWTF